MKKSYFLFIAWNFLLISVSVGQVPGNQLFDNSKIHEIKIVSLKGNLRDTLESNYLMSFGMNQLQIRSIPYTPAKLIVDGTILDTLGIRYKGFNSWWHSVKKPIKIDLNRYKSGQEYDGLKKFNLHNGSGDPTFIRENIDYKMLRSLGIKAPRTSYAKVFLDTSYIGLYRVVEQVDNAFLDVNFGNHNGNLYVQEAVGTAGFSMSWEGSGQETYYKSISLENHQKENDWSEFIHFLDVLNNTSDKQFRDSILSVFNVDQYLQILAFDVAVNNLDYYGNSGRNFYLYDHNGIFHWIPWDYNLSWREGEGPLLIESSESPVLIRRILEVPEFQDVFLQKYCRLKSCFSSDFIGKLVDSEAVLISSYLQNDPFEDYPFEAFLKNLDSAWMRLPGLKQFASKRYADISNLLETLHVDCNITGGMPPYSQNLLQLYPIPADDWVNIGIFPSQKVNVSIINSGGQVVLSTSLFEKGILNISSLPSGFYLVKANTGKNGYSKLLLVTH